MRARAFAQVDVFGAEGHRGNPVAVVLDAEGLDDAAMQRFAAWTNLSETTFVTPADDPAADYAVRIFTPDRELPFAGHPTLGSCHAWAAASGRDGAQRFVQACPAGLVEVRRTPDGLAFAAPPLVRSGPVDEALVAELAGALGLERHAIVDAAWADNGPGWLALLLGSADEVLALRPALGGLDALGVVGPHPAGSPEALEVRAFFRAGDALAEDPVTGSLNASVAQWLLGGGRLRAPYVARQGTALGRVGRVHVGRDGDGTVWIGGATTTLVEGTALL